MLRRVGAREARNGLAELLLEATGGRRILLTQHRREVAALVSAVEGKFLERLERAGRLAALMGEHPEDV